MYNFKDEDLDTIIDLKQYPVLEISVEEDEDGFQIFTPEFFVNESLGSSLDEESDVYKENYKNSFNWFGFGIED